MVSDRTIWQALQRRSVSRRDFLKFCTMMSATLALPHSASAQIATALETKERLPVVWLHLQECTGDDESFLRVADPTVTDILLEVISLEYNATLMADSGHHAEEKLQQATEHYAGRYVLVVEGSIPTGENAHFCTIAGRAAENILREVSRDCAAIVALGACAAWGGWPAATPNPTGAQGVSQIIKDKPIVNLTGCPHNGVNLAATIVYYLTFGGLPELDSLGRPLFAHGKLIHDNCERRAHFDAGEFVAAWGDEGHRQGWCLYKTGCKGPVSYHNCPVVRWNEGHSWPVGAGHGCVGCSEVGFWEYPIYGVVPIFEVELPAAFPPVEEAPRISVSLPAAGLGAVIGIAIGAAAVAAAMSRPRSDEAKESEDREEQS